MTCCALHLQADCVGAAEEEKATDAQQDAFALLSSAPQRAVAAEILSKVLRNIVEHPTEAKYRYSFMPLRQHMQQQHNQANGGAHVQAQMLGSVNSIHNPAAIHSTWSASLLCSYNECHALHMAPYPLRVHLSFACSSLTAVMRSPSSFSWPFSYPVGISEKASTHFEGF